MPLVSSARRRTIDVSARLIRRLALFVLAFALAARPLIAAPPEPRKVLHGQSGIGGPVLVSPDGLTVITAGSIFKDGTVRIWDLATGRERAKISLATNVGGPVIALAPDGKQLAVSVWNQGRHEDTCKFAIYELGPGEKQKCVTEATTFKKIRHMVFSRDGKTLAIFGDGGPRLGDQAGLHVDFWDTITWRVRSTFIPSEALWGVAFACSPDGRTFACFAHPYAPVLAAEYNDRTITLRDSLTGELTGQLEGHSQATQITVFSPDSQSLVSSSPDRTVKVWRVRTGELLKTFILPTAATSLSYSSDGKYLAAAFQSSARNSGGRVRLWEMASYTQYADFNACEDIIRAVIFSPDSKSLITSGTDAKEQAVKLWSVSEILGSSPLEVKSGGVKSRARNGSAKKRKNSGNPSDGGT